MEAIKVGDKFTICPPNSHIVDVCTKVKEHEIYGTWASWRKVDCTLLSSDAKVNYLTEEEIAPKWRRLLKQFLK